MKGPPGILSVEFVTAEVAQQVMKKLNLFTQATSLGGSMSLIDWRYAYVLSLLLVSFFPFSSPFFSYKINLGGIKRNLKPYCGFP